MSDKPNLAHHVALMDTMAGRVGADLEAAVLEGAVRSDEVVDAVFACQGCSAPGACQAWLAAHHAPQENPPAHCANAALFARLALPEKGD